MSNQDLHSGHPSEVILNDETSLSYTSQTETQATEEKGLDNAAYQDEKAGNYHTGISTGKPFSDIYTISNTTESKKNGTVSLPSSVDEKKLQSSDLGTKLYVKRWFVLCLFCLFSFSNAFQWIHLNIVANVIISYYNESLYGDSFQRSTTVDWLSIVYMIVYIPLIFPATWLLDKKGLRLSCIVGSLLNALGAWLKCASVSPDRFALLMFAQTICAIAQLWVLNMPPRLAAVWFGINEVSTATSVGVFGNQLGVAVGFLVPPILVTPSNNTDDITNGLYAMSYGNAVFASGIFVLIIIFFKDRPVLPPSRAQQCALKAAANEDYRRSLKSLFTNFGFMILVIAYGINTGSYYAISTLLNAMFLSYFPGEEVTAGRIGLTMVLTGILASVLAGIWLDRTKTFKGTTIGIYVLTIACAVAFHFTLDLNEIWIVFLTAALLGFFMTGYLPVGFEFAAELTFPESEGTSSGLLNASAMVFGMILTIGMRAMIESVSVFSAKLTVCIFLLVGGVITAIIKPDYKRQEAGKAFVGEIANQQVEVEQNQSNNKTDAESTS